MPTFDDLNSLYNYIQNAVGNSLSNEVANDVSDKMKEHYMEEVYSYTPNSEYRNRRMSLVDDSNIQEAMLDSSTLEVSNIAKPDDSVMGTPNNEEGLLAQWIEHGDIPNIFNSYTGYPWADTPRPVIQHTEEEIEQTKSHVEALKRGLKRQGIDAI